MAKAKKDKFLFVEDKDNNKKDAITASKKDKNKEKTVEKKTEEKKIEEKKTEEKKNDKKTEVKNDKKKKTLHYYGPIEFSFNFISLVIVICVGLYFGGRSFYYYSLQNQKTKETAMTLNGMLLTNNKLVKDDTEGLHQDENGYYFKGNIQNNYVWFANRMFRVLRINDDDTIKLVTDDLVASFMWGDYAQYEKSNVKVWLTGIEKVKESGVYYKTIPAQDRFITKTKYTIDRMNEAKIEKGDNVLEDDIVSITLSDYIEAGGKNSFLNNGKLYFLLGYNSMDENLYVEEDGSIMSCDVLDGYGIRAVFTMNKNIPVSQGDGTKDNPYVIDQGNDINYVDSYVKLGNDTWKVFEQKDEKIKMYLNGYITVNGQELVRRYSAHDNRFNYFAEDNIGFYLYNDYVKSLSYSKYIVGNKYPYGEISDEKGFYYPNVYKETYDERIGLLNIFDYVSNNELTNFFYDNTLTSMSTSQYSKLENGLLEEAQVTDQKHIVPVISISTKSIKGGNGRIDNPYVVE